MKLIVVHIIASLFAIATAGCIRQSGGHIAFQSNRDGNFEIYTMDADGSEQRRLTNHPANDIAPAWAPDGSQIAFASDRDGTWDIYTVYPDGTGLRQLTKAQGANTAPSWTVRGVKILFISTRDALNGDVYAMNTDGSSPQRLTSDSLVKDTPILVPDGKSILVTLNIKGRFALASLALPGGAVTIMTTLDHNSQTPVLSADGNKVLFASDRDGVSQIYSMALSGRDQIRLTLSGVDERSPSYSATSNIIIVAKKGGIYEIALDSRKERVLSFKGDYAPTWHSR